MRLLDMAKEDFMQAAQVWFIAADEGAIQTEVHFLGHRQWCSRLIRDLSSFPELENLVAKSRVVATTIHWQQPTKDLLGCAIAHPGRHRRSNGVKLWY